MLGSKNEYWWSNQSVIPYWEDSISLAFLHLNKVNVEIKTNIKSLVNLIANDFSKLMNEAGCDWDTCPIHPIYLAELSSLKESGIITSTTMKKMLEQMFTTGKTPFVLLAENENYISVSDEDEIKKIILVVLSENEDVVKKIQEGHKNSMGFLMGKAMKISQGKAKPETIKELLEKMSMEYETA